MPYFFYNEPNIAQSIIVIAVSALVGYSYYLENLKKPDYVKIFTERQNGKDEEVNEILRQMRLEVNQIRESQGKIAIVRETEAKAQSFKW
tara:strand:- start:478 stop:747 length:270 start_codon:yes stop_codon:yes gene_type:complete